MTLQKNAVLPLVYINRIALIEIINIYRVVDEKPQGAAILLYAQARQIVNGVGRGASRALDFIKY